MTFSNGYCMLYLPMRSIRQWKLGQEPLNAYRCFWRPVSRVCTTQKASTSSISSYARMYCFQDLETLRKAQTTVDLVLYSSPWTNDDATYGSFATKNGGCLISRRSGPFANDVMPSDVMCIRSIRVCTAIWVPLLVPPSHVVNMYMYIRLCKLCSIHSWWSSSSCSLMPSPIYARPRGEGLVFWVRFLVTNTFPIWNLRWPMKSKSAHVIRYKLSWITSPIDRGSRSQKQLSLNSS